MALKLPFLKARGQAPAGASDVSDLVRVMTQMNDQLRNRNEQLRQLPLAPEWQANLFGPGWPIRPEPLDDPNEQGFVTPRIQQYPVQWNIPGHHDRVHVPWQVLRRAAEQPLFRACIEIRKQRISTLDWCFRVNDQYAAKMARSSGKSQYEIEEELRREFQDDIDRLTNFWSLPDRKNGLEFADWMSQVQEEQLVWDALAVYPQKTYGGDTLSFTVIDGSTIKPLLDEQGGRPMPPFPAYQQLMYGFPRGDFTADTVDVDGKLVVPGAFSTSQLVYRRRVVRTWTPYGFSPVEQALLDGALWDKRFAWMMAEYTEGAQPVQYLVNHGEVDWDANQLLQYEKYLNDRLSGKTGQRMRNPLLPAGIEPVRSELPAERYGPDYDLFLIKLVAMHFGVMMTELGFSEPGGLGSTGYHEGQEDIQFRKDLTTVRWLNAFITGLSRTHLDMNPALEFAFLGLDEEDEPTVEGVDDSRVRGARMTVNEGRVKIGLPPSPAPEADMLMLMTERGVVFLDGASEAAPPGVVVEPAELRMTPPAAPGDTVPSGNGNVNATTMNTPRDNKPEGAKAKVQGSNQGPRPVKQSASAADMAKELEQYAKWLQKGRAPEEFEFRCMDQAAEELVHWAVKAGGADPKASSRTSRNSTADGLTLTSSSPYSRPSS